MLLLLLLLILFTVVVDELDVDVAGVVLATPCSLHHANNALNCDNVHGTDWPSVGGPGSLWSTLRCATRLHKTHMPHNTSTHHTKHVHSIHATYTHTRAALIYTYSLINVSHVVTDSLRPEQVAVVRCLL